jgi:glyoxylase-like metal-dependent hydrolase (beta-lactamase superfamily II)
MMKKIATLIAFFFSVLSTISAQDFPPPPGGRGPGPGGNKGERMKAMYVAYISDELKLSEDDAQKFWPVHSQYEADIRSLNRDLPELDREQAVLDIKKKYQDKFSKVLGKDRTDEFYKKDAEFRKKMVDKLKEMRERRQGGEMPDRPNKKQRP